MKNKILFLDTETTGTSDTDRICQIAYKIGSEPAGCELFKPPVPISIEAMSITHITEESVADKHPFKNHGWYGTFSNMFTAPEVVAVAHNADFDLKMFEREGLSRPKRHVCTMKMANYHDTKAELGKYNLQYLRYYYKLAVDGVINPHDALSDVIVLEKLFEYYLQFYTIKEMVEISSRPILVKKMMFGKHKGEWLKDIIVKDREYMEWMWKSMEMDENLKYTVAYYLKGHHRTNQF